MDPVVRTGGLDRRISPEVNPALIHRRVPPPEGCRAVSRPLADLEHSSEGSLTLSLSRLLLDSEVRSLRPKCSSYQAAADVVAACSTGLTVGSTVEVTQYLMT
jgi:hypothetical protein